MLSFCVVAVCVVVVLFVLWALRLTVVRYRLERVLLGCCWCESEIGWYPFLYLFYGDVALLLFCVCWFCVSSFLELP